SVVEPYTRLSDCPTAHRALPSFPTRRSSDLPPHHRGHDHAERDQRPVQPVEDRRAEQQQRKKWQQAQPSAAREVIAREQADCHRSEEHTSELQSRENLVCRLLLEKKKKTKVK